MKIGYTVERKTESNTFVTLPLQITACCPDALTWLFQNVLDIAAASATLIKRDATTGRAELFNFCQYCGKKHETEEFVSVVNQETGVSEYRSKSVPDSEPK